MVMWFKSSYHIFHVIKIGIEKDQSNRWLKWACVGVWCNICDINLYKKHSWEQTKSTLEVINNVSCWTFFCNLCNSVWCKPCMFIIYKVNEKCTAKCTEGESTPHYEEKNITWDQPSEAWFLSYSLLTIKENVQSVHLQLQHMILHIWTVIAWLTGRF
jgi:hypothetical protein